MLDQIQTFFVDHLLLILGSVAVLLFVRRMLPGAFQGKLKNFAALYPVALCVPGALFGLSSYEQPMEQVAVGIVCGLVASYAFQLSKPLLKKIFKRTFDVDVDDVIG